MLRNLRTLFKARFGRTEETPLPGHLALGKWGESVAEGFLRDKGFRTLARRVRIGARNEIDLVVQSGKLLVFVEVKTRASEEFGRPAQAVGKRKRYVLARAARRYLQRLKFNPVYYRFDVVEVVGSPDALKPPVVRHIEAALTISNAPFPLRY